MNREAQVLERVNNPNLFNNHNGITVTAAGGGKAQGVLQVSSTSMNPHGIVHGGCLYTLADTVAGSAVAASCGGPCVTVSGTMEFLRPATGATIHCEASAKKLGSTICTMEVELTNQNHKVVATGTFIFMLVQPKA